MCGLFIHHLLKFIRRKPATRDETPAIINNEPTKEPITPENKTATLDNEPITPESELDIFSSVDATTSESFSTKKFDDAVSEHLQETKFQILSPEDPEFFFIYERFRESMDNITVVVKSIIKLHMPYQLFQNHIDYRDKLASDNNVSSEEVVHTMFHGTNNRCDVTLLLDGTSKICENGCSACGIIRSGFKTEMSSDRRIWCAASSVVSAGYCRPMTRKNKNLTMFVVDALQKKKEEIISVDRDEANIYNFFLILYITVVYNISILT
ncbi:16478_t:CDS:2 [Acaulospora morrowiae]|uniref:16478_t:CDS:1 n=1 Tax=Acaulospora morrowiae TaxID=94023 RepID=A0A9N9GG84_9GLOM|nr:16478_t:CDS:2 [Acaulospora morrowiae]